MKAIVIRQPGGPERLEYVDLPEPTVQPGELLVNVAATAINHFDIWLRKGKYGLLPRIPGMDVAGVVTGVSPGVPRFKIGDRVLLNPAVTCDACKFCYAGEHGLCLERQAIGQLRDGGCAEFISIPWRNAHSIGDELSFEQAAATPTAFMTAWQLLMRRARVQVGETVLVMAAASGVGSAAVQIAKLVGARVIAAVGGPQKLQRIQALGADEGIDYGTGNLHARVLELTEGDGVDVIADPIGSEYWPIYLQCVRTGGRIVTCGAISPEPAVNLAPLLTRQISLSGCGPVGSKFDVEDILRLLNRGRLHGVVDTVLPLKDAPTAHELLEQRRVVGKVILVP